MEIGIGARIIPAMMGVALGVQQGMDLMQKGKMKEAGKEAGVILCVDGEKMLLGARLKRAYRGAKTITLRRQDGAMWSWALVAKLRWNCRGRVSIRSMRFRRCS